MKRWKRVEAALNRHRKKSDTEKQDSFVNMIELDDSSAGRIVKIKIKTDVENKTMCLNMIDAVLYSIGATSMIVGDEVTIICPSNEIADGLKKAWSK